MDEGPGWVGLTQGRGDGNGRRGREGSGGIRRWRWRTIGASHAEAIAHGERGRGEEWGGGGEDWGGISATVVQWRALITAVVRSKSCR